MSQSFTNRMVVSKQQGDPWCPSDSQFCVERTAARAQGLRALCRDSQGSPNHTCQGVDEEPSGAGPQGSGASNTLSYKFLKNIDTSKQTVPLLRN